MSGHVSKTSADVCHTEGEVVEALVADVATLVWCTCWREPQLAVSLHNMVNNMFCILAAKAPWWKGKMYKDRIAWYNAL